MPLLRDHFRGIAEVLQATAKAAGATGHSSTTGRLRELIVHKFLKPHLPRDFEILSGIVIDSVGNRSTQQDCLIVDSRFPLVDIGGVDEHIILAESVVAAVEVKSTLDKEGLLESLSKAAHFKELKRKGSLEYRKGPAVITLAEPPPILSYIFAFEGLTMETALGHLSDFAQGKSDGEIHDRSKIVDGVCVLNKGVLLIDPFIPTVTDNSVYLPQLATPTMWMHPYHRDALFAFYRRLHSDVTYLRMQNYDLDAYYSTTELE